MARGDFLIENTVTKSGQIVEARNDVTLAIDPGLRHCGAALFVGRKLKVASLVRNPEKEKRGPEAWVVMAKAVSLQFVGALDNLVIEVPQVYLKGKGNPDDLIELAGVAGAIVGAMSIPNSLSYKPRQWKGNVPKNIHHDRLLNKLSTGELACIPDTYGSLTHNVLDAVGIGLKYLGR